MSRSKNSRLGSKHVKGCPGCSQCDHNRPVRQLPGPDPFCECGQPSADGYGFCDQCWQSIMDHLQLKAIDDSADI